MYWLEPRRAERAVGAVRRTAEQSKLARELLDSHAIFYPPHLSPCLRNWKTNPKF